jgi:hypothetical protein
MSDIVLVERFFVVGCTLARLSLMSLSRNSTVRGSDDDIVEGIDDNSDGEFCEEKCAIGEQSTFTKDSPIQKNETEDRILYIIDDIVCSKV